MKIFLNLACHTGYAFSCNQSKGASCSFTKCSLLHSGLLHRVYTVLPEREVDAPCSTAVLPVATCYLLLVTCPAFCTCPSPPIWLKITYQCSFHSVHSEQCSSPLCPFCCSVSQKRRGPLFHQTLTDKIFLK